MATDRPIYGLRSAEGRYLVRRRMHSFHDDHPPYFTRIWSLIEDFRDEGEAQRVANSLGLQVMQIGELMPHGFEIALIEAVGAPS